MVNILQLSPLLLLILTYILYYPCTSSPLTFLPSLSHSFSFSLSPSFSPSSWHTYLSIYLSGRLIVTFYIISYFSAHEKVRPSGYLFLADFGESVPSLVNYSYKTQMKAEAFLNRKITPVGTPVSLPPGSRASPASSFRSTMSQPMHVVEGGPSNLSRSRGTLAIQSPEMLCLTVVSSPIALVPPLRPKSPLLKPFSPSTTRSEGKDCFSSELDSHIVDVQTTTTTGTGTGRRRDVELNTNLHLEQQSQPETQMHTQIESKASNRRSFPPPTAASDVWSLGCLLLELLTGK